MLAHGIDIHHALPGVGEHLADHYISRLSWRLNAGISLNQKATGIPLLETSLRAETGRHAVTPVILAGLFAPAPGWTGLIPASHRPCQFENPAKRVFDRFPGMTFGPCRWAESRGRSL